MFAQYNMPRVKMLHWYHFYSQYFITYFTELESEKLSWFHIIFIQIYMSYGRFFWPKTTLNMFVIYFPLRVEKQQTMYE